MIETSGKNEEKVRDRLVEPAYTPEDIDVEYSLRPKTLNEYIGQDKVKENLSIYIEAAKARGDSLDHVLLAALIFDVNLHLRASLTVHPVDRVVLRGCALRAHERLLDDVAACDVVAAARRRLQSA